MDALYESLIDELVDSTIAMEVDILAGGDPNLPRAERTAPAGTDDNQMIDTDQQNANPGVPEPDNPEGTADVDIGGDDLGGEDDFGDAGGGDDDMGGMDNQSMQTPTGPDPTNQNEVARKIDLRKCMNALYDQVSSSVESMSDNTQRLSPEQSEIYYTLKNRLSTMKDILFKLITEAILSDTYEDVLRKYTAIEHAYTLAIVTLDLIIPEKVQKRKRKTEK